MIEGTGYVNAYHAFAFHRRYEESDLCWNGILREISYAEGATILPARLNTLRLNKL